MSTGGRCLLRNALEILCRCSLLHKEEREKEGGEEEEKDQEKSVVEEGQGGGRTTEHKRRKRKGKRRKTRRDLLDFLHKKYHSSSLSRMQGFPGRLEKI